MTRRTLALTAAAFCVLSPAWADVTATVGMTASQTLDLDTGALGTGTAADLLYTGFNGVLGPLGNGTGRRLALLLSFAEATAGAAAIVITVAYVREILHRGETEFTLLMAGVGLGSTVTAILIGRFTRPFEDGFRDGIDLHRRRHRWTVAALLLGGILLSAALVPGVFLPPLFVFAFLWILNGAGQALVAIPSGTLLAEHTEESERGRAYAAHFALTHACWLITYPAAGYATTRFGAPLALTLAGVLCIAITSFAFQFGRVNSDA